MIRRSVFRPHSQMDQRVIFKVTIPPEEILATRLLICQVNGCTERFSNASHLQMHLARHHRLTVPSVPIGDDNHEHEKHFHCPVESCVYHLGASGEKFFNSFRYLKQHFLKVHSVKVSLNFEMIATKLVQFNCFFFVFSRILSVTFAKARNRSRPRHFCGHTRRTVAYHSFARFAVSATEVERLC